MRHLIIGCSLAAVSVAGIAHAQTVPAANIDGRWSLAIVTSEGVETRSLNLRVAKDGAVSGTVGSQHGEIPIRSGQRMGNALTVEFAIAGGQIRVVYRGTIERDTLRGTWRQNDEPPQTFVGIRGDHPPSLVSAAGEPGAFDAATRRAVLTALDNAINHRYAIPESAPGIVAGIRARDERGEYDTASTAAGFAQALTRDLRAYDKHFAVFPLSGRPSLDQAGAARTNFGFRSVERLDGNVGYIRFDVFSLDTAGAHAGLSAALAFLASTDAMIIDLRDNRGGNGVLMNLIVAHFIAQDAVPLTTVRRRRGTIFDSVTTATLPLTNGDRRYLGKPVYILTSSRTASAAEWFSHSLQALGRATIIGEPSAGAAHAVEMIALDATFGVNMPVGRVVSRISNMDIEGTGVRPDVAVPGSAALDVAHSAALQRLRGETSDPAALAEIERAMLALKNRIDVKKH